MKGCHFFRTLLFFIVCNWASTICGSFKFNWKQGFSFTGINRSKLSDEVSSNTLQMTTKANFIPSLITKSMKWLLPSLGLYLYAKTKNKMIPLNKQSISYFGPFFQGWLIRSIDPIQNISSIFIVGSFSPPKSNKYHEHYVFCAIDQNGHTVTHQELIPADDVTVTEFQRPFSCQDSKSKKSLDILWRSKKFGFFHFTDDVCKVQFSFPNLNISLSAKERIPWSGVSSWKNSSRGKFSGPEGWLEYTHLLPCHYFIYSVGSTTTYQYTIQSDSSSSASIDDINVLSGEAYSHIEGNHGTFFPAGWVWSQGIGKNNQYSFSLVSGEFCIGGLSPMNTCLYLRRRNGKIAVIRSIDSDNVKYNLNGISKKVEIYAVSLLKGITMNVTIEATDPDSFHRLYVPTANGFSNQPGCKETYTARAKIQLRDHIQDKTENYEVPLTALEFGGSFINSIHRHP